MDELITAFSLERINKAGAKFDILKAQWYNQHYLRQKSNASLATQLQSDAETNNITCTLEKAERIVELMKDRVTFPQDFWQQGKFLFIAPTEFDQQVVAKKWNDDVVKVLSAFRDAIGTKEPLTAAVAKETLESVTAALNIGTGKVLQAVRLSITGAGGGPDLMIIMEILGKDEVVRRIDFALKTLKVKVS